MQESFAAIPPSPVRTRRTALLAALGFVALFGVAIAWAKWVPYWHKGFKVSGSHSLGDSPLTAGGVYGLSYLKSIWPALVAALLIASGIQTLLPQRWLVRALDDRRGGPVRGALLALPSLMCTCCTAPVAVSLRRRGAGEASALAYWVGNPALNPAVLVFMAFVLSWQWVLLRGVFGVLTVVAVAAVARRLCRGEGEATPLPAAPEPEPDVPARELPVRFAKNLARFAVTLVPEYVAIVFVLGLLRDPLFPLGDAALVSGVVGVVLFAVVGTLFVIPTAAEIPIVQGALALGIGAGPAGALLITLPALSLPSLVMVGRSFPRRVLAAAALTCALVGVACGAAAALIL